MRLPKRLQRQPLVESLIEMRIGSAKQPMPDVLPGLVFSQLSERFSRTEVLPIAGLPKTIRDQDPNLRFKPHHRLIGDEFVLSVGDHMVALSRVAPYGGWEEFRAVTERVLEIVDASGLIESITRYSMKSLNVIPPLKERQLDMIKLRAALDDEPLPDQGFFLRTELNDDRWLRIVEVAPNATSQTRAGTALSGLQLNVDCIRGVGNPGAGLTTVRDGLDELHDEAKRLFFSLLTEDTLEKLEPEYDDRH